MMATLESGRDPFNGTSNLEQSPARYGEVIYGFNQLIHAELQQALDKVSDKLSGVEALAIPGSDGRFEKGSLMSQIEVIAILPEKLNQDLAAYKKSISETVQRASPSRIALFEWKQLGMPLSPYNGDKNRIQPARITDARRVWGKQSVIERVRKSIGQEILGADGSRIKDKVAGLERAARKAITGKNRIAGTDAVHFELDGEGGTGQMFFNPHAYQLSFKIGPLRLVQNTILAESIKHVRREGDSEFLNSLRSNISRRLEQLSTDKLLNLQRESVNAIIDHYNYFLRMYHKSEQAYLTRKETVLPLTAAEVLEIKRRLVDLSQLMSSLRIGRMH